MSYVVDTEEHVYGPVSERVAKALAEELEGSARELSPSPTMLVRYVVREAGKIPIADWLDDYDKIEETIRGQGELVSFGWVEADAFGWRPHFSNSRRRDFAFIARFATTGEDPVTNNERADEVLSAIRTSGSEEIEMQDITGEEEDEEVPF